MRPDRALRGALRRMVHGTVTAWYHPSFRLPLAGLESRLHIDPRRAGHVLTWALDQAVLRSEDVHQAPEIPWGQLRLVHDETYLASLDRKGVLAPILGVDERIVPTSSILETWRHSAGATTEAARAARDQGGRHIVLLGGFHHAHPALGGGFCGINDVAVAIAVLRSEGFTGRIAVIDLDAHPPDGTAACLAGDPDSVVLSLSAESAWEPVPEAVDLRLPAGSGDAPYLQAVQGLLEQVGGVELVFYLAGADPLRGDPYGGLDCTEEGLRRRDRMVLQHLEGVPVVLLPAGGYTHAAWRVFAGTLAEAAGAQFGPAPKYDPTLRRSLDISRTLDPATLTGRDSEEWITADELREALGMGRTEERYLGFYTRQGVEYALCRYGLMEELRRMGFEDLRVEVQASRVPHSLRVLARIDGRDEAIVESAVRTERVGEYKTLFIEWLTLRDPRAPFTEARPRLPGQDAPGLGLLEEVGHVNLRTAERLDLDGLSFVPSWYHIAWFARRRWIAVDPEQRGRIMALHRLVQGRDLLRATTLLSGPGLPVEIGGPVRWEPCTMVYPRSDELRAWLARGDRRAADVADALESRLLPLR